MATALTASEQVIPSVGAPRREQCPHCGNNPLAATSIYAITSQASHLIGGYAICEECTWSPYTSGAAMTDPAADRHTAQDPARILSGNPYIWGDTPCTPQASPMQPAQPALLVLRPGDRVLVALADEPSRDAGMRLIASLRQQFPGVDFTILGGVLGIGIEPPGRPT